MMEYSSWVSRSLSLGYMRKMKYTISTKEPARLSVIKDAIDGGVHGKAGGPETRYERRMDKAPEESGEGTGR
jgi:uncharacterized protein YaiE (UPF0345 family)